MRQARLRKITSRWFVLVSALLSGTPSAAAQTATAIKTVYVIPSSHWDLGFLVPPEEILPRLKPHIDEVIADAKADPEFRWTIESVWQIREWLARTSNPQEIKDFVELVNKGQIQVSAVFGSMHTEFMGAEALNRIVYDMKTLEKQLGIKTDFAMMDDVPGFTLRLPQVLARSGVHYFVNGANLFLYGGTSLTPAKLPFYWESPDGSRVLTWQTQGKLGGYTEAMADYFLDPESFEPYTKEHFYPKEWEGLPRLEIMRRGVNKLLARYQEAKYPYDALMLLYLHDFISPEREAKQLLPAIREWNAAGKQPKIVVATPREFFNYMETTYGKEHFPVYAGDYSGLWSAVKINSPVISAEARWVQDHLPVAEMIWSLLTFRNFTSLPTGNLEGARLKLFKYDEHSGAAQVGWPKLMTRAQVNEQNKEYVDYASTSKEDIEYLIQSGLQTLLSQKSGQSRQVVVFNPLSWQRSDLARLKTREDVELRDVVSGRPVPLQRLSPDEVVFFAEGVPPLGYATYAIESHNQSQSAPAISGSASDLENSFYRLRLLPEDGVIASLFDKQLNREIVDSAAEKGMNQLLRWIPSENFAVATGAARMRTDRGPLFDRITISRPETYWPETQITLYHAWKRLEISNLLDRGKMPFVASNQVGEYYSFNFPFLFESSAQVWIDNGVGFHRIPNDYLPGARTDAATPQHCLVLAGKTGVQPFTVVLSQRQAFFDYLPGLPRTKGPNTFLNAVRATVMRKQDQGETRDLGMVNFSTVEPGLPSVSRYDFALTSAAGGIDATTSYREGASFDLPLIAMELQPGYEPAAPRSSFFSVDAENVVILAFKPSADGNPEHYALRLQEVAGSPADFQLNTPLVITSAEETTLTEDQVVRPVKLTPLRAHISPHETLTLRLTIPHPHKERSERWWEW